MKDLEKEFKSIEFQFIRRFKKKPSMEAILLLIGYQESPQTKKRHDKEEKLDLINLGVLTVLARQGYFEKTGSEQGWPSYEPTEKPLSEDKELVIKKGIVDYFKADGL